MTHHVAVIDFFQETAAVFDGGDVGLIPVPEVGILQTVVLMGVRKVVFLDKIIYFFHAISVVVGIAEITNQLIGGLVVAEADHIAQKLIDGVCLFQFLTLDFLQNGSGYVKFDQACGILWSVIDGETDSTFQILHIDGPGTLVSIDHLIQIFFQIFERRNEKILGGQIIF